MSVTDVDPYEAVATTPAPGVPDASILSAAAKCGPGGDCSSFTRSVLKQRGIAAPRTAVEQFHASQRVGQQDLAPGDLVFFDNKKRDNYNTGGGSKRVGAGYVNHVGIYAGNGQFVADHGEGDPSTRKPQDLSSYLKKTGYSFMGGGRFGGKSDPVGGGAPVTDDPYEAAATGQVPPSGGASTDDPYEAAATRSSAPTPDLWHDFVHSNDGKAPQLPTGTTLGDPKHNPLDPNISKWNPASKQWEYTSDPNKQAQPGIMDSVLNAVKTGTLWQSKVVPRPAMPNVTKNASAYTEGGFDSIAGNPGRSVVEKPNLPLDTVAGGAILYQNKQKAFVVVPLTVDGKKLTPKQAVKHYEETNQHLGVYQRSTDAQHAFQASHGDLELQHWNADQKKLETNLAAHGEGDISTKPLVQGSMKAALAGLNAQFGSDPNYKKALPKIIEKLRALASTGAFKVGDVKGIGKEDPYSIGLGDKSFKNSGTSGVIPPGAKVYADESDAAPRGYTPETAAMAAAAFGFKPKATPSSTNPGMDAHLHNQKLAPQYVQQQQEMATRHINDVEQWFTKNVASGISDPTGIMGEITAARAKAGLPELAPAKLSRLIAENVAGFVNPISVGKFTAGAAVHPLDTLAGLVDQMHTFGKTIQHGVLQATPLGNAVDEVLAPDTDIEGQPITTEQRVSALIMVPMLALGATHGIFDKLGPALGDLIDEVRYGKQREAMARGYAEQRDPYAVIVEAVHQGHVDPVRLAEAMGDKGPDMVAKALGKTNPLHPDDPGYINPEAVKKEALQAKVDEVKARIEASRKPDEGGEEATTQEIPGVQEVTPRKTGAKFKVPKIEQEKATPSLQDKPTDVAEPPTTVEDVLGGAKKGEIVPSETPKEPWEMTQHEYLRDVHHLPDLDALSLSRPEAPKDFKFQKPVPRASGKLDDLILTPTRGDRRYLKATINGRLAAPSDLHYVLGFSANPDKVPYGEVLAGRSSSEEYTIPNWHKQEVAKAIRDGKSVPPHVLAEYPELKVQPPKPEKKPSRLAELSGQMQEAADKLKAQVEAGRNTPFDDGRRKTEEPAAEPTPQVSGSGGGKKPPTDGETTPFTPPDSEDGPPKAASEPPKKGKRKAADVREDIKQVKERMDAKNRAKPGGKQGGGISIDADDWKNAIELGKLYGELGYRSLAEWSSKMADSFPDWTDEHFSRLHEAVFGPKDFKKGKAVWDSNGTDIPGKVTGFAGEHGGKPYAWFEQEGGGKTGVPLEDLTYETGKTDPPVAEPKKGESGSVEEPKPENEPPKETGLSMEQRAKEAAAAGLKAPESKKVMTDEEMIQHGKDAVAAGDDPYDLVRQLAKDKLPASKKQYGVILEGQRMLQEQLNKAHADLDGSAAAQTKFEELRSKIDDFNDALDDVKAESGASLQALKVKTAVDPTNLSQVRAEALAERRKGANKNKPFSKAEETNFEDLVAKAKKAKEDLQAERRKRDGIDEDNARSAAEEVVTEKAKRTKRGRSLEDIQARRQAAKDRIDEIRNRGQKGMGNTRRGAANTGILEDAIDLLAPVAELVTSYIEEGIVRLPELVERIRKDLRDDEGNEPTDDEVHRLISGYGIDRPEADKSVIEKTKTELKKQAALLAKINDAIEGVEPDGHPKSIDSSIVAGLKKSLAEVKKIQDARNPKAMDDSVALTKRIEKLLDTLEHGPDPLLDKPKPRVPDTPRIAAMRKRAAALGKYVEDKWGRGDAVPQAQANRLAGLQSKINAARQQLEGNYRNVKSKPVVDSDAVEAAKKELARINKDIDLTDKITDLNEQLRTGQFKRAPKKPVLDRTPLEREYDRANESVKQAIANQKKPTVPDVLLGLKRQLAISGFSVLGRIPISSAINAAISPFENLLAQAASKFSGIEGETEARANLAQGAEVVKELFTRSTLNKDDGMLSALLGHGTELARKYGDARQDSKLNLPAHTHEALTYPAQKASFLASAKRYTSFLSSKGVDVTRPEVMEAIGKKAYTDSLISTFRNENAMSKVVRKGINMVRRQDATAGAFVESLMPVVNLPTNVAGRMGEYAVGIEYGIYKQVKAARAAKRLSGVEAKLTDEELTDQARKNLEDVAKNLRSKKLTGDQKDAILRAYKRGAAGAVLMAIGYYFAKDVDKIPDWLDGVPPIAALKWGRIIRKSAENHKEDVLSRGAEATGRIARNILTSLPETTDFQRPLNAAIGSHYKDDDVDPWGKFWADYLLGWVEPAAMRDLAKMGDKPMVKKGAFYYKARGFRDQLKLNTPLLRQTLPEKKVPAKRG